MDNQKEFRKGTVAEVKLRLNVVYQMVLNGYSRKSIVQYCADNYKLRDRQVDKYIRNVSDQISAQYGEKYKEKLLEKGLAQLDDLYVKNYTNEDFKECRGIIESKLKIVGLGAANRLDLTTSGEKLSTALNITLPNGTKLDDFKID